MNSLTDNDFVAVPKIPKCYILVGVPASGKTTWISNQAFDWKNTIIASTDDFVELTAKAQNSTYNDVFADAMPAAVNHMIKLVKHAISMRYDIVWDQTSVSVGSRKKKLNMIPNHYEKIAVFFPTPSPAVLNARLESRIGKSIPHNVMNQMINDLVVPTNSEGFDAVIFAL